MLSSWGVPFDAIDVEAGDAAALDLKRMGVPLVPAIVIGNRVFHGWDPPRLAEFVGVSYQEPPRMTPDELALRLDMILVAAQHAIRRVPADKLGITLPGRNRTVRNLAYHIFRLSQAFPDALKGGFLGEQAFLEDAPPSVTDSAKIARYGQTVRESLKDVQMKDGWCDGSTGTYYGTQTAHELLERTTWHAAQHLRQLYALMEERMDITTERAYSSELFQGLNLPSELW